MAAAERVAGGAMRTGRSGGRRRCSLNQPRLLERVVGENNAFMAYVSAFSTRHQFPRLPSSSAETAVQFAHCLIVPRRAQRERPPIREGSRREELDAWPSNAESSRARTPAGTPLLALLAHAVPRQALLADWASGVESAHGECGAVVGVEDGAL